MDEKYKRGLKALLILTSILAAIAVVVILCVTFPLVMMKIIVVTVCVVVLSLAWMSIYNGLR